MRTIWLSAVLAGAGIMVMPATPAHAAACDGRAATITGTDGADRITGTDGADVIVAGAGDDDVFALGGNDIVCLGTGNDSVFGGAGADRIDGGPGDDWLSGGPGDDTITGAEGNDVMVADGTYDGADTFHGSSGLDKVIYSHRSVGLTVRIDDGGIGAADQDARDAEDAIGADVETIWGSQGNDTIVVSTAVANDVEGGIGDDTIDVSDGVPGNDKVTGGYGIDQCRADEGDIVVSCP